MVVSGIVSLLMALLLPAIMLTRESARRLECTNHLRQIGMACHNYHDVHSCLPAAWQYDTTGRSASGWAVRLFPYIDQQNLLDVSDQVLCSGYSPLEESRTTSLTLFRCPSDVAPLTFDLYESGPGGLSLIFPVANYVGVYGTSEPDEIHPVPPGDGTFINSRPVRFSELTRGLSNTIIVGERSVGIFPASWLGFDSLDEDAECRVAGSSFEGPNCRQCDECEFGSRHAGVSAFLFGDGHVLGIADKIDKAVYQQIARRHE
ncbi:DUF1559 domain-containing protein [Lacunimicrobium album]